MPGELLEIISVLIVLLAWGLRAVLTPFAKRRQQRRTESAQQGARQPAQRRAAQRQAERQAERRAGERDARQRPDESRSARRREEERRKRQRGPAPAAEVRPGEPIVPPPPPPPRRPPAERAPDPLLPEGGGTRSLTAELLRELGLDVEEPAAYQPPPPLIPEPPPPPPVVSAGGVLEAPPPLIDEEIAGDSPVLRIEPLGELGAPGAGSGPAAQILRDLRGGPTTLARAVLLADILAPPPGLRPPGEAGGGGDGQRW